MGTSNNDLMYFYPFLKHDKGMNRKLMEFQTTIQIYNPKSSVEPEIFPIFQHKVERIPHFTRVTEMGHIQESLPWCCILTSTIHGSCPLIHLFFSILWGFLGKIVKKKGSTSSCGG